MNIKYAQAHYLYNLAKGADYFRRVKTAAAQRAMSGVDFDSLSDLAVATNGLLRQKQASMQQFGVSEEEANISAIRDAASGVIRLRNLSI